MSVSAIENEVKLKEDLNQMWKTAKDVFPELMMLLITGPKIDHIKEDMKLMNLCVKLICTEIALNKLRPPVENLN